MPLPALMPLQPVGALTQPQGALTRFMPPAQPQYGLREDGTPKGLGYFGMLPHAEGGDSSELSIGVNLGGKETLIPSLVPTLSRAQIDHLLSGKEPTEEIVQAAVDHARQRMEMGLPVWALPNERVALPE